MEDANTAEALRPAILIVDDLNVNRVALKKLLKDVDADLIEASSGNEALIKSLESSHLALVLLDVQMPEMDGYEVAEFLQHEAKTTDIPIIFITAIDCDEAQSIKGYGTGAVDFLNKPIESKALLSKVRVFLNLWKLRAGLEKEIASRIETEKHIRHITRHDDLCGIPNRKQLYVDLAQAMARVDRFGGQFAVLFLDLDGFKAINDRIGHDAGDLVLKETAKRAVNCVRSTDTVARFGGDEFVILLSDLRDYSDIILKIEELIKLISEPIAEVGGEQVGVSIGVAIYPDHGKNVDTLITSADQAMYLAKQEGRGIARFFSDEMNNEAQARIVIEDNLKTCIQNEELSIVYQPIVNVSSGFPIGAEALLRWNNEELGFVPPDRFIPVAESSGKICEIGLWVLNNALVQGRHWQDEYGLNLRLSVNASTRQFNNTALCDQIEKQLSSGTDASGFLEIEITESLLMDDSSDVMRQFHRLRELGVQLSVDDFGTGYSSLSYLKRYPVNTVKIDRSFIMDIPNDKEDMALVRAIVAMAHGLHLEVIAEGVETQEQWDYLKELGCDYAQGYFFSKPQTPKQFEEYLRQCIATHNLPRKAEG